MVRGPAPGHGLLANGLQKQLASAHMRGRAFPPPFVLAPMALFMHAHEHEQEC